MKTISKSSSTEAKAMSLHIGINSVSADHYEVVERRTEVDLFSLSKVTVGERALA